MLTTASYDISSADLIEALSWDTLDKRRLRAKSTLRYKILNDDPAPNLRYSFVKQPQREISIVVEITDPVNISSWRVFLTRPCVKINDACRDLGKYQSGRAPVAQLVEQGCDPGARRLEPWPDQHSGS